MELTGDQLADEIKAKMAEGEEVDLDELLSEEPPPTDEEFEPVPR